MCSSDLALGRADELEQALLELVRTAESAGFKALQRLLKETALPRE